MAATGPSTVAAIIVAAGDGTRLGAHVPKAFVTVAGATLLERAATRFLGHDRVRDLVVAAPVALADRARDLVPAATIVAGGPSRQHSVAAALAALANDVDAVLVHDVARPFVPDEVITRVIGALDAGADAAVPTLAVTDTIRRCDPSTGELGELVDRDRLRAMQTPQGFSREILSRAHALGEGAAATDDAALVERLGARVVAVAGDELSFKITVPIDLALAEVVARG